MKLDKYDKMFIAFMFVVVTIVSICNCVMAVEGDNIEFETINGLFLSANRVISEGTTDVLYYIELEPGYVYDIDIVTTGVTRVGYSDSLEVGSSVYNFEYISNPTELHYSIDSNETSYLFFNVSSQDSFSSYSITRSVSGNYGNAVNGLVENVGFNQLWGVFENGIDFVGVVVLCAFGFFLVFLLIKKITKGKSDF